MTHRKLGPFAIESDTYDSAQDQIKSAIVTFQIHVKGDFLSLATTTIFSLQPEPDKPGIAIMH